MDLSHYGPNSLLGTTYQILSKVITRRITSTLDRIKPREQADFRYDYSTLDHLKSITPVDWKDHEAQDASGCSFHWLSGGFWLHYTSSMLQALKDQAIEDVYLNILDKI